jgi:hypothetical protein
MIKQNFKEPDGLQTNLPDYGRKYNRFDLIVKKTTFYFAKGYKNKERREIRAFCVGSW